VRRAFEVARDELPGLTVIVDEENAHDRPSVRF
jgi:hypothetical protein